MRRGYNLFSCKLVELEVSKKYPTGDVKQALESLDRLLRIGVLHIYLGRSHDLEEL